MSSPSPSLYPPEESSSSSSPSPFPSIGSVMILDSPRFPTNSSSPFIVSIVAVRNTKHLHPSSLSDNSLAKPHLSPSPPTSSPLDYFVQWISPPRDSRWNVWVKAEEIKKYSKPKNHKYPRTGNGNGSDAVDNAVEYSKGNHRDKRSRSSSSSFSSFSSFSSSFPLSNSSDSEQKSIIISQNSSRHSHGANGHSTTRNSNDKNLWSLSSATSSIPGNSHSHSQNNNKEEWTSSSSSFPFSSDHGSSVSPSPSPSPSSTHVKNIDFLYWGNYILPCWYYSPFPNFMEPKNTQNIFICKFCLKYTKGRGKWEKHQNTCRGKVKGKGREEEDPSADHNVWLSHLDSMGIRIYDDETKQRDCDSSPHKKKDALSPSLPPPRLVVYEFDGSDSECKLFCQFLCLLSKLFIDHKTIYFDVSHFTFYVLYQMNSDGFPSLCAYFSKEKSPSESNNLACILTFPQYQKLGFGKFLISLSYEISRRENQIGGPERPLSDLGRVSFESYWKFSLCTFLIEKFENKMKEIRRRLKDKIRRAKNDKIKEENQKLLSGGQRERETTVEIHVSEVSQRTQMAVRDILHVGTQMGILRFQQHRQGEQLTSSPSPSPDDILMTFSHYENFCLYVLSTQHKMQKSNSVTFQPKLLREKETQTETQRRRQRQREDKQPYVDSNGKKNPVGRQKTMGMGKGNQRGKDKDKDNNKDHNDDHNMDMRLSESEREEEEEQEEDEENDTNDGDGEEEEEMEVDEDQDEEEEDEEKDEDDEEDEDEEDDEDANGPHSSSSSSSPSVFSRIPSLPRLRPSSSSSSSSFSISSPPVPQKQKRLPNGQFAIKKKKTKS